ncbi:MAG: esterase family protein [Anaerolineales bacterium]
MDRFIDGWHSPNLNQHMEIVTYGHYGFPLLMFPTAAADYLEYERFLLIDSIAQYIDAGKVKVFSINSINRQAWMNRDVHPGHRVWMQHLYNEYVVREVVPYIWNSCQGQVGIITTGASLGGYHAANQLFRRPDLFDGMIAMSGNFNIRSFTDGYYDDNVYYNDPLAFIPNLNDEAVLSQLRAKKHIYIVSGQGSYENPQSSRDLAHVLGGKGIPHELDLWGYDMPHDWPTWRKMLPYYLGAKF